MKSLSVILRNPSQNFLEMLPAESALFLSRAASLQLCRMQKKIPISEGCPGPGSNQSLLWKSYFFFEPDKLLRWVAQLTAKEEMGLMTPRHPAGDVLSSINNYRGSPCLMELFSRREGERTSSKAGKSPKLLFRLTHETLITELMKL